MLRYLIVTTQRMETRPMQTKVKRMKSMKRMMPNTNLTWRLPIARRKKLPRWLVLAMVMIGITCKSRDANTFATRLFLLDLTCGH